MSLLEGMSAAVATLETTVGLFDRVTKIWNQVTQRLDLAGNGLAYENLSLDVLVEIRDPRGTTAVLQRRQRVRFRDQEGAIIRDLVWGDGEALARYAVKGARRLDVLQEGSKRVVLLGLDRRPVKGARAVVSMRRLMRNAFLQSREYFETLVERPTRRLSMKIVFPPSRPPKDAELVTLPPGLPTRRVPVRYTADRRPFLAWSERDPDRYRIYSLRWSW